MELEGKENTYTLMKELGRGTYGATYLARGLYGDMYAVKHFFESGGAESRDFEEQTLRAISNICKKHAVCFKESITQNGEFFVVMEYIRGQNVNSLIFGTNKCQKL